VPGTPLHQFAEPIRLDVRDGKVHSEEVFWRKDGCSFPIEYTSTPLVKAGSA
jgi:hypothetical protein